MPDGSSGGGPEVDFKAPEPKLVTSRKAFMTGLIAAGAAALGLGTYNVRSQDSQISVPTTPSEPERATQNLSPQQVDAQIPPKKP